MFRRSPTELEILTMNPNELEGEKLAAIEQWSADPCGPVIEAEPGTKKYFERLVEGRHEYGSWMQEELGYAQTGGLNVLDVGCGQGIDLYQYAAAGARATGIDLTPRHAELAKAHLAVMGLEATVVNGDAEHLPFEDASFDRVSSNGVLHHTPDMPAALAEIRRVLRPTGEARIIVYNKSSLHYWFNQFLGHGLIQGRLIKERSMANILSSGVERTSIGARPLVNVYRPKEVGAMLRQAGFIDVRIHTRHFRATDAFPYSIASKGMSKLRDPRVLDSVGRKAGWYVIGRAIRP